MVWPQRFWLKLQSLFRRNRSTQRLNDEFQFHLDQQISENLASGMSPEEARYAAMRTFGNPTFLKEQTRDTWGWLWLEQFAQDLRHGFRLLRKNPSFPLVAVATLALGIAATAVLYSIFDGAYIHFGETDRVNRMVLLAQQLKDRPAVARFSPAEYFDIAGQNHYQSFDGFFAIRAFNSTLSENLGRAENPELVRLVRVTPNMFSLFGISPLLGRMFTAEEDRPGGPNVALLTYRLWDARFGRNPDVLGKTIYLDGIPYATIGVMPRRSQYWGADLYVPIQLDRASGNRQERDLRIAGVAKEGISSEQTRPELAYLAHSTETQYAAAYPEYKGLVYEPIDVRKAVIGDLRIALYIMMGAVALLALITAANIASLLVARTMARAGEIGTRMALGATPVRLARQFLTESILLSTLAGIAGLAAGVFALKPILAMVPERFIGDGADVHTNPTALLISISVALLLGILFGLAPAFFVSRRGTAINLQQGRTRSATDQHSGRMRVGLVLVEMALAFIVVMGAGLMARTYQHVTATDFGFRSDHVLTMMISLPESKYPGGAELANLSRELLTRARALPGVMDVCASSNRPAGSALMFHDFSLPGRSLGTADGIATAAYRTISPAYFKVIGSPLREGRFLTEQDGPGTTRVAVVNESFARTYFPGEDPVGKQILMRNRTEIPATPSSSNGVLQIVGVAKDARQIAYWQDMRDLYKPISPEIYVPLWQHSEDVRELAILLRTAVEPATLTEAVRREVLALDAERPIYGVETLQSMAENALGPTRLCLLILGTFAGVALLTACVGLYAIVSYSVTQRTHEIGIRIALGAKQRDVLRLVAGAGIPVVVIGLVVGLLASLGLTRLMSSIMYGVSATDAATLAGVSAILTATAVLAVYIPARRATRVDPLVTLRYE